MARQRCIFAGSGQTIPKEHFFGFESILGKAQDFGQLAAHHLLSFFVVNCRRPVCVSRCNLAPKGFNTSSSNSLAL